MGTYANVIHEWSQGKMQKVLNAAYSFVVQKHATESDFLKQNGFQLKNILNTTYVKWHINQLLTNISRPNPVLRNTDAIWETTQKIWSSDGGRRYKQDIYKRWEDIMLFLKISGTLKIINTSEIMRNDISRIWHLPNAPVLDFCNVYIKKKLL